MRRLALLSVGLGLVASAGPGLGVEITGTVVDADGKPVTDATVLVRYAKPSPRWEQSAEMRRPDQEGRFRFVFQPMDLPHVTNWPVAAFSPQYALVWQRVADGESCTLKLADQPVPCGGVVVDEAGKPIAGATVFVQSVSTSAKPPRYLPLRETPAFTRETDGGGRFAIGAIPPGVRASLEALAPGRVRTRTGFQSATPEELRIELPPAGQMRGRMMHDGRPAAGVEVSCAPHDPGTGYDTATTDEDGRYMLDHLSAGTYNVLVYAPEGLTASALEGVAAEPGQQIAVADIELIEGGLVEGTVAKQDTGQPVPDVPVGAYGPGRPQSTGTCYSVFTDDTGRYRLRLPPGPNKVYFQGGVRGYSRAQPPEQHVEVEQGETISGVDFALIPDKPFGGVATVVRPDGTPAPGVLVTTQPPWSGTVVEVSADGEGRADIGAALGQRGHGGRQGDNVLWGVMARDPAAGLAGVAFVSDWTEPVQIQLSSGAYVVAKAVDMEGRGMAGVGARVWVHFDGPDGRDCLHVKSNENGEFRIGPLPARQALEVLPSNEANHIAVDRAWWDLQHITLEPGEERELPPLRLNPAGATAEGRVLNAEGQPITDAVVAAAGAPNPERQPAPRSDAEGRFRLTGLRANGTVTLLAFVAREGVYGATEVSPESGYTVDIVLRPLGKATGAIFRPGGEALAETDIRVWSMTLQDFTFMDLGLPSKVGKTSPAEQTVKTDADGAWEAENLIGGLTYDIIVPRADQPRSATRVARFTAEGDETVEVEDIFLEEWQLR